MSNKEKVFSVMSREDSKKFANEYFENNIRNNYQLIPGFNLDPVVENKNIVDNSQYTSVNNSFDSIKQKNSAPSYVVDINLDSNHLNDNSQNYSIVDYGDSNIYQDTVYATPNQDENKNYIVNHNNNAKLATTDLSSSYHYNDNNNSYSQNIVNDSYEYENKKNENYTNFLNSSYDQYSEKSSLKNINNYQLTNNTFNNNSNDYINDDLSEFNNTNEFNDFEIEKNKEYKNNLFKVTESENLQSLLSDYNMDKNFLSDDNDFDDTYFSYLSKKKIKTIISEKLGYCDEEMLDEIHSKAISENWKELDVQKWLLNPENISRFKEMNYDFIKTNDSINFSSSEIDKSLFDSSTNDLNNLSNFSDLKNNVENINEKTEKENLKNFNSTSHVCKKDDNFHDCCSSKNHKYKSDKNYYPKNNVIVLEKDKCNCINNEHKLQQKISINEIKSNQKLFEKEMTNKFDFLNNQIENINDNFKATLVDESYRKLLLDNQTETIKNYLNEKLLNSQFFSPIFSKIRETDNFTSKNKQIIFDNKEKKCWNNKSKKFLKNNDDLSFNKVNSQINKTSENQNILYSKINELNKKMSDEINEINSVLSNWEKNNNNEFNEIKNIVCEISNKLDLKNKKTEDKDSLFDDFKNTEKFVKEYISTDLEKEKNLNEINAEKNVQLNFFEDSKKINEKNSKNNSVEIIINPIDFFNKSYESNFDLQEKAKELFKDRINDDLFSFKKNKNLNTKIQESTKINFFDLIEEKRLDEENLEDEIFTPKEIIKFEKEVSFNSGIEKIDFENLSAEKEINENICDEVLFLENFEFIFHEFKSNSFIGIKQIEDSEFCEIKPLPKKRKNYIPAVDELYQVTEKDHEENRIKTSFLFDDFNGSEYIEPSKKNENKEKKIVYLNNKSNLPTADELYQVTEKDHEENRIKTSFLFDDFNGPEYIEPSKKNENKEKKIVSLNNKSNLPTADELYQVTEKDHEENKIKTSFLFNEFDDYKTNQSEKTFSDDSINNLDLDLVTEKVNNFNDSSLEDISFNESFDTNQYHIFENKNNSNALNKAEDFNLIDNNELIDIEKYEFLNEKNNDVDQSFQDQNFNQVKEKSDVNLNLEDLNSKEILVDLSNKNISEFSNNQDDYLFFDEKDFENQNLDISENQNEENKIKDLNLENLDLKNSDLENKINFNIEQDNDFVFETNKKDSQNLKNNNYNLTLDKLKKERHEKISKELIDNSEKFIDKVKENVANELDDVIKSLEDLNINDDSIYDIENIKIKFKNI